MNTASQSRLAGAQKIASAYAENPRVAAVLLGGSTARGHADRYSDIEIGVFWHAPPREEDRARVVGAVQGDLIRLYPYDELEQVWADDFMLGRAAPEQPRSGILTEVVHYTKTFMEQVLDEVLLQYQSDELKQNLLAGVDQGLALFGHPLIAAWQRRTATYPDGLALAVVDKHAQIDHFWRWEMWLERGGNLMMLYRDFSQAQQKILHVLLALNRVYYFGFKWLDVVVARLAIAPRDLSRRLRSVYEVPPAEGAQQLAGLVEETYNLIEQNLPPVNVSWLREVFRYRRPLWEEVPASGEA